MVDPVDARVRYWCEGIWLWRVDLVNQYSMVTQVIDIVNQYRGHELDRAQADCPMYGLYTKGKYLLERILRRLVENLAN